jgi:hypothetical protein
MTSINEVKKLLVLIFYIGCIAATLVYFHEPLAADKVKVAFVLLSMMIWSSIFSFFLLLYGWGMDG